MVWRLRSVHSHHKNDLGIYNTRPCDFGITIGDGSKLKCEKIRDLKVKVLPGNERKASVLKMSDLYPS